MTRRFREISRRHFVQTAAALSGLVIVPRRVVAGAEQPPPSETFGGALIGCGGRGGSTFQGMGPGVRLLAQCDVKFLGRADNQTIYSDYRRLLERKDIDVVAIATHPGWHALVTIAAMEAGKDVLCEKPMTRFIAEGRAVAEAERRYNRIFQIGTYGRFGANRQTHKLMASGLVKECKAVHIDRGGFNVRRYCGKVNEKPSPVPQGVDWDMYCGPAPLRPFTRERFGGTHRYYWDYEGGGLADFGQHHLDGFQYAYAKDYTSPVEVEAYAPPAHPECTGLWGWVEMKYADGLTLVLESGEWGEPYTRKQVRGASEADLSPDDRQTLKAMPDPEPLVQFPDAIRTRKPAGGHAEASHRCATLLHLANIAIRTGRKIKYDPVKEQIIGDEEANRLAYQPMRAPWRL